MEILTSISKPAGRKTTDTATVHYSLFTIHYSLFAICLAASSFAHDIETTSWGVCWKRQESMPEAIGPTNTPGSDSFCDYRLSAPADLAFLDGFDTRLHAASCTNVDYANNYEIRSDGFPKVTNTTYRLSFFDSVERRKQNVRKLCPWYDADKMDLHNTYSGMWGSTFMDSLPFVAPKRHDFEWTTDPFSEFYSSDGTTGWFAVFYGLKKSNVFSPHEQIDYYIQESQFYYEGIAARVIENITFEDPGCETFLSRDKDATPFTFETVLSNAFENVACTDMLSSNRRLLPKQLAGCNQALSLMDKTVRVDNEARAITNRCDKHFHFGMFADGTYGGSITITKNAGGDYTVSPLNMSFAPGSVTVTNSVAVSNNEVSVGAPCLSLSVPSCQFGASLTITNVSVNLSKDSAPDFGHPTLSSYIDYILEELGQESAYIGIETYVYPDFIYIYMSSEVQDIGFLIEHPKIEGTYIPEGKASFSSEYNAIEAYQCQGGGSHENWPANRTYLKYEGITTTFFSSYAATRKYSVGGSADELVYISFSDNFGHGANPTDQWNERVGYGYRAKTHKMNFPSQYLGRLAQEIGTISSKMFELAPNYDNPSQYVGVNAGDFRTMCERADRWALNINTMWFGQSGLESPSDITMLVSRSGSSYKFTTHRIDHDVEFTDTIPIITISASLSLVDDEVLNGYEFPDKPFLFNSRIKSVSEAEWDFPQVRLKGEQ